MYSEYLEKRVVPMIDGGKHEISWLKEDKDCFKLIVYDWWAYSEIIMKHVPDKKSVLQAGGNCGLYPLLYANHFDRVFTFEPEPKNFYCLTENCKNNKIIKFNAALSDKSEFVGMGLCMDNVGMHRVGWGDLQVFSMKIDSLELEELSLMHLDLEGHELPALIGATETLKRCKPVVVVETGPAKILSQTEELLKIELQEPERVKIFDFLGELGYKLVCAFGGNSTNKETYENTIFKYVGD
jgi:FkbM family methyltransferase